MTQTESRQSPLAVAVGLAVALAALAAAPAAQALTFAFKDVGSTPMTAPQLAAFQAAGNHWSSRLSDNVTVYVDISFADLGPGVFVSNTATFTNASYAALRGALVSDAKSALDSTAVASLQPGPALSFLATQGDLSSRLDNDGSSNNTRLGMTTANAKALGLATTTSASNPDGSITFASAFANTLAYSRDLPVPAGLTDFITVAEHELGHMLGFTSGVDDIDFCAGPGRGSGCALSNTANRFENTWWYDPLDLFRYSAPGVLDLRVGGSPYLSVDGGASAIEALSTGVLNGNSWGAGHFGPAAVNLMRPFVERGPAGTYDANTRDLAAFDAIGWDLAAAVPEPAPFTLWALGLLTIGRFAAGRQARAA